MKTIKLTEEQKIETDNTVELLNGMRNTIVDLSLRIQAQQKLFWDRMNAWYPGLSNDCRYDEKTGTIIDRINS
jgi:hypothetical protein